MEIIGLIEKGLTLVMLVPLYVLVLLNKNEIKHIAGKVDWIKNRFENHIDREIGK